MSQINNAPLQKNCGAKEEPEADSKEKRKEDAEEALYITRI